MAQVEAGAAPTFSGLSSSPAPLWPASSARALAPFWSASPLPAKATASSFGRAKARGLIEIATWNPRDFAQDNYRSADERPYGGGPGMVMMVGPLRRALDAVRAAGGPDKAIYLSPQGARLTQRKVEELARREKLFLLCGRYEGIDYRVVEDAASRMPTDEVSIGDYVLAGGEAATLVMVEAISRLVPGVVGNAVSVAQDSFADGLLEGPVYTRPQRWRGRDVPEVLLSGDHAAIARWRTEQSLLRTAARRPDLLEAPATDG